MSLVGVDDRLGHVGAQAGNHAALADHLADTVHVADASFAAVEQGVGAGLVWQDERRPDGGVAIENAGVGVEVFLRIAEFECRHGDGGDLSAGAVLGVLDGVEQLGPLVDHAVDGVEPGRGEDLQDVRDPLARLVVLQELVLRRRLVAEAHKPVDARQHTRQRNALDLGPWERHSSNLSNHERPEPRAAR